MSLSRILNDTPVTPPPQPPPSNNSLSRLLNDDEPVSGPSNFLPSRTVYSPKNAHSTISSSTYPVHRSPVITNNWAPHLPQTDRLPSLRSPPIEQLPADRHQPSHSNGAGSKLEIVSVPSINENGPTTRSRKKRRTAEFDLPKRVRFRFLPLRVRDSLNSHQGYSPFR